MLRLRLTTDTLTASFDAGDSQRIAATWLAGLIELFSVAAGVPRATVIRTVHETGSEDEPRRRDEWVTSTGAVLVVRAEGIASRHGVHGEDLSIAVRGLPDGVELHATSSIDHRRGGHLEVTLRGRPGDALTALAGQLDPGLADRP